MKIAGLFIITCIIVVVSGKRNHLTSTVKLNTCNTICDKYKNSPRKVIACKALCYRKVNLFVQKCKNTCNGLRFEMNRRRCRMRCIRRGHYLRQGGKGAIIACGHRCQLWKRTVIAWAKEIRKCRVSCWAKFSKKKCRKICRRKLRKYIKKKYKLGIQRQKRKNIVYICGSSCKLRKWFIRCRVSCRKRGLFQSRRKCRKRCLHRYKQKRYMIQRRPKAKQIGLRVRLSTCTRQCGRKFPMINVLRCRRQCYKEYRQKRFKLYKQRKIGRIAYKCGHLCKLRKIWHKCKRNCYTKYCKTRCFSNYRKYRSRYLARKRYRCGVKCRLVKQMRLRCNRACLKHSPASICSRKCNRRFKIHRYRITVKRYRCGLECKWRRWLRRCKTRCSKHLSFTRAKRCNLICNIKYRAHMLGKMFISWKSKRKLFKCKHQCGYNRKCFKNCMKKRKSLKHRIRAFMLVKLIRSHQVREKISYACSFQVGDQVTTRLCPSFGKNITCNGDTLAINYNGRPATYTFCNYKDHTLQPSYVSMLVKKSCSPRLHRRQGTCFNGWKCEAGPIQVTYNNKPIALKFCKGKSFHPIELFGPTFGKQKTDTVKPVATTTTSRVSIEEKSSTKGHATFTTTVKTTKTDAAKEKFKSTTTKPTAATTTTAHIKQGTFQSTTVNSTIN